MTIDYTDCDTLTAQSTLSDAQNNLVNVPHHTYRLRSSESDAQYTAPQYAFVNSSTDASARNQCIVQFDVPFDLDHTVLLYYKLTNFYQNHRRYVQSYDSDQLKGKNRTKNDLHNGNCKPVAILDNKVVYPCGLIANSMFNGKAPFPPLSVYLYLLRSIRPFFTVNHLMIDYRRHVFEPDDAQPL